LHHNQTFSFGAHALILRISLFYIFL